MLPLTVLFSTTPVYWSVLNFCGPNYSCEFQKVWSKLIFQKILYLQTLKTATR